jgi:hypothetical protein
MSTDTLQAARALRHTITVPALKGTSLREEVELPEGIQILEGDLPQGKHCFRIMDPEKGDERLTWDSGDWFQIKAAKELFVKLIKKGLKPFRVGTDGKATSEAMSEFDPHAEEVIFLPQALVAGG